MSEQHRTKSLSEFKELENILKQDEETLQKYQQTP